MRTVKNWLLTFICLDVIKFFPSLPFLVCCKLRSIQVSILDSLLVDEYSLFPTEAFKRLLKVDNVIIIWFLWVFEVCNSLIVFPHL